MSVPEPDARPPEPLAHSARDGIDEQTYRKHIAEVCRLAALFAGEVAAYSPKWHAALLAAVSIAAAYHDLGKLDEIFQAILCHNRRSNDGFNHCEAGTAHLLRLRQFEAALLAYSHHIGLPSIPAETKKNANGQTLFLRDTSLLKKLPVTSNQRTDEYLESYLALHRSLFSDAPPVPSASIQFCNSNLSRRIALSCLVDADHSDTARNYGSESEISAPPLRAAERLAALDAYVTGLSPKNPPAEQREQQRLLLRQKIYAACRHRNFADNERLVSCDSPVGTGKTTAVMAHLLRIAAGREPKLRRIFVVLPYTNIIDQSVEVYRIALTLPGETPENIVAAHHHKAEFAGDDAPELRQLTQRWEAPIIVVTAVQFFETLAANATAPLRKLHQLPGSAVFIDETHAAMPAPLWPQMWRWITELCDDWNCHFVLASGSLARFWTLDDFVPPAARRPIPRLIDENIAAPAFAYERNRVRIATLPGHTSLPALAEKVRASPGPRLVIFNTIQSAAAFAHYLRFDKNLGANVEHLSTALSPADRAVTLARIRQRLRSGHDDWVLVATSCVEAGVDFSFHTGFRERSAFASLLQVLGRVSRNGEHDDAIVFDFQHDASGLLNIHPHFKTAAKVVAQLFEKYGAHIGPEQCTEAFQAEINQGTGDMEKLSGKIAFAEQALDFPEVAKLCRLITADTQTVVVNPALITRFKTRDPKQFPTSRELMMHSVQIWHTKLKELPLTEPLGFGGELIGIQDGCYDDFLGYMHGYLPILKGRKDGFGAF